MWRSSVTGWLQAREGEASQLAPSLMMAWLFKLGAAHVFVTIVSGNAASSAVARRAGFTYEGRHRAYGVWQGRRHDVDVRGAAREWVEGSGQ